MYTDILVVTDRADVAEAPVRHRSTRRTRFLDRLSGLTYDLLVPTDLRGGDRLDLTRDLAFPANTAVQHAIGLAAAYGATLHVLYTIDSLKYDTSFESALAPLREEGEVAVERIVDDAEREGVAVESAIEVGRPAKLVADYVAAHGVDLVALNTRDRGALRSLLGPSVAESVIGRVTVPVYTVPPAEL